MRGIKVKSRFNMSTQEKIAKQELEKSHIFRQRRITKQVRIEQKYHKRLKQKAIQEKMTISKLLDEMVMKYL